MSGLCAMIFLLLLDSSTMAQRTSSPYDAKGLKRQTGPLLKESPAKGLPAGTKDCLRKFDPMEAFMLNTSKLDAVRAGMEVITADGKHAGYVVRVESGELVTREPERHLPLDWIRRIDDDVHIGRHYYQLADR
ncbi:MAG: DUF2171 domain-containing protein [Alphaproteobacteria bacterium]|nr:MAG: DUF2171 domain-containing protein [Alphaproteobacteria bacterium]